jgi:hypothetical protein
MPATPAETIGVLGRRDCEARSARKSSPTEFTNPTRSGSRRTSQRQERSTVGAWLEGPVEVGL